MSGLVDVGARRHTEYKGYVYNVRCFEVIGINKLGRSMKFLHITDPHLVARPQMLFDIDVWARLEQAVESMNSRHGDAELCVLTGGASRSG